jgi:hypothetical protein
LNSIISADCLPFVSEISLSLSLLRRGGGRRNGGREGGRSRLLTDSGEEETKIDAVLYTATVTQRREGDEPPLLIWVENVRGGNNTILLKRMLDEDGGAVPWGFELNASWSWRPAAAARSGDPLLPPPVLHHARGDD